MERIKTISRPQKELGEIIDSEQIQLSITRMLSSIDDDPELAIGTAKEFVETMCKTILDEIGIARTGRDQIPELINAIGSTLQG